MAWLRLGALVAGVVMVAFAVGLSVVNTHENRSALDRQLAREDRKQVTAITEYFARARDLLLLQAQNDAFTDFYAASGTRDSKIAEGDPSLVKAVGSLSYLEHLYDGRVGEICFIDIHGAENARLVKGRQASFAELSRDESHNPFFQPTIDVGVGNVYQAAAYISPDTHDLVISNSTMLPGLPPGEQALVHFEVSMASFASINSDSNIRFLIVDATTGATIADSAGKVPVNAEQTPGDMAMLQQLRTSGDQSGIATINGQRAAFEHLRRTATNANDWYIIAASPPADPGLGGYFDMRSIALIGAACALFMLAFLSFRGYQRRLELAAVTDGLTGLPNRNMLSADAERAIELRRKDGGKVAVLLVDLDRFKDVNDTLGHQSGDQLLTAVGPRIRSVLRDADTIARLGGDEFAVLLPSIHGPAEALEVAARIRRCLRDPFVIGEIALEVEASVGIAVAPDHGDDFMLLLQHADMAMYNAKLFGLGASLYETSLDSHDPRRLSLLAELRLALDHDELVLHYQPKVSIADDTVCGAEALLRWEHPQRGLTMPDAFVPYAEHTALIQPLTDWALERAIKDVRAWLDAGREIPVSVNVSARSLHDNHLCETIARLLDEYRVPSRMLVVEITETAIMTEPTKAREVLATLDAMGVQVSVDDFGTGHASLVYLTTLPIHELKIDRTFVTDVCTRQDHAVIIRSVVDLGHNLGLRVVAEGVEDDATRDRLALAGCLFAQGYRWSRPVPVDVLDAWMDRGRTPVGRH